MSTSERITTLSNFDESELLNSTTAPKAEDPVCTGVYTWNLNDHPEFTW